MQPWLATKYSTLARDPCCMQPWLETLRCSATMTNNTPVVQPWQETPAVVHPWLETLRCSATLANNPRYSSLIRVGFGWSVGWSICQNLLDKSLKKLKIASFFNLCQEILLICLSQSQLIERTEISIPKHNRQTPHKEMLKHVSMQTI